MTEESTTSHSLAALHMHLGLTTEGIALDIAPASLPGDLNPWLLDLCVIRVDTLGHWDRVPRSHDWENLLPLLRPGEELLWLVDYRRGTSRPFTVRLALRFNNPVMVDRSELQTRESRFRAIVGQLRRQAFPESTVVDASPAEAWALFSGEDLGSTLCVTGIPSPKHLADDEQYEARTGDRANFQSLNDVVEAFLHLPAFRLTFVVGRVGDGQLAEEFGRVSTLRNHVHPLVKAQAAKAEQVALSWQEQRTEGEIVGSSREEQDNLLARLGRGLGTLLFGSRADGTPSGFLWERAPASRTASNTSTRSEGSGVQRSAGRTETVERLDSALDLVDQSLERYAENLYSARATGAYRAACFVQAHRTHANLLADSVRGVLSGARSKDRPVTTFPIHGEANALFRGNRPTLDLLAPAAPVLTDLQACQYLLLPEAELPGVRMHRSVFLGRNAAPDVVAGADASTRVRLGRFAFTGEQEDSFVEIDAMDLHSHVLVCGTTGSGKTRRVLSILNGLAGLGDDVRIIVVETAKRTYREEFCRSPGNPPHIYTLGDATATPLRVNPFYFEPGTSLKRHVSVVADALAELMPTEALIGPKMREAVERVFLDLGWDIESGAWQGTGSPRHPTVIEFVHALRKIAEALNYGREVNANYRGALEGRARIFLDATFQDIFSHDGNRDLESLFDRDTIIEMEGLPSSEIDIPAFMLSILVERLRSHQLRNRSRRWLLVIEEAHNVLPRSSEEAKGAKESDGAHTLLKNLVRLLQEGREMGIGVMVVDQSPTMLARGVLKNTNTKVVMRLEDASEIAEMGQVLGLEEGSWSDLGVLRSGEAIVKASYMAQPVKSARYSAEELPKRVAREPAAIRIPPAYEALERAWSDALAGRGPLPDARWWREVRRRACGSDEVVRFGLGRALLREWTGAVANRARSLLGGFQGLASKDLLGLARSLHSRARGERAAALLIPLERRILAALADLSWVVERPDPEAVGLAAELLSARRGGPSIVAWRSRLGPIVLARPHRAAGVGAALRQACLDDGDAELGPAIRLITARLFLQEHPAIALANDALRLDDAVAAVVDELLTPWPETPGSVWDTLASGIAKVITTYRPAARPPNAGDG